MRRKSTHRIASEIVGNLVQSRLMSVRVLLDDDKWDAAVQEVKKKLDNYYARKPRDPNHSVEL